MFGACSFFFYLAFELVHFVHAEPTERMICFKINFVFYRLMSRPSKLILKKNWFWQILVT